MQPVNTAQGEIEEAFARIDKNGDRRIDIEEFAALMLELDSRCSADGMRASFNAIDLDHDGRVTFDEFLAWCR